jgi:hypothetical protein
MYYQTKCRDFIRFEYPAMSLDVGAPQKKDASPTMLLTSSLFYCWKRRMLARTAEP